jgi:type IV pilus assembly protein PilV
MKRHQHGLTLIEVLVSILVMAIGLVGMAALQTNTMKYQQGATQRAMLSGLISDFAERVRANDSQAPGRVSNSAYLRSGKWSALSSQDIADPSVDCLAEDASCSPQQLAAYDQALWLQVVRDALPKGTAVVEAVAPRGMRVTLMWADKDYVSGTSKAAVTSASCVNVSGAALQSCCPASVEAAAGVHCANFTIVP